SLGVASSEWFTVRRSAFGVHGSPLSSADIQQGNAGRRTPNREPLLFKHLINSRPQARRRTEGQFIAAGEEHLAGSILWLVGQHAGKVTSCVAKIPIEVLPQTYLIFIAELQFAR